ncbi:MAG: CRTAC1 family protein [bacterium]|nr:CRTAC1 family protein [bacterium]
MWVLVSALLSATIVPALAEVRFTDVTAPSGIRFQHNAGNAGQKWLPETMGSGCAFFDSDGDGWLDILPIHSKNWSPAGKRSLPGFYRNNKNGTFTDITAASGFDVEGFGLGVSVADYDNDGRDDVYVTYLGGDRLFRNLGGGKFRDVTRAAGLANRAFPASAAWLDYDKDGLADLFVANYVQWTAEGDLWCSLDGQSKSYCTPESYDGTAPRLYRNLGGGKFEDVSERAGIDDPTSKALGITVLDYDMDGWVDLFVANDTEPNRLYHNNGDGTFTDEGMGAGVAYSEDGVARGAMGVDAADYDRSGRPHLLVGNFSNQMLGLYHNEGNALFLDEGPRSSVGRDSLLSLTFGAFFFDYDLDGWLDIFAANGHIEEEITNVQPKVSFAQPPHLFRNLGDGKFREVTKDVGAGLAKPIVARGAAYGDYDRDGDLDILISTNDGPAHLFRNDGGNSQNWLTVALEGVKSNRSALGAVVRVKSASGEQWQMVKSGSSYCSQSQLALTFGLGSDSEATVTVEWPSGQKQTVGKVKAGQSLAVVEK